MSTFTGYLRASLLLVILTAASAYAGSETRVSELRTWAERPFRDCTPGAEALGAPTANKYVEGELLVKFKDGVTQDKMMALHAKYGAQVLEELPQLRVQRLKLREGMSVEEGVKLYQEAPEVEYAEPNNIMTIQPIPGEGR